MQCFGATEKEVESGKFNIWIGISLGNKYFTKENIKEYILWALENTKENVLIVVGDRLYAIKLEALDKYNKIRAFRVAARFGDKKEQEVNEIIEELPKEKRGLVKIARFRQVTDSRYYEARLEVLREGYKKNEDFRECVINIVKDIYGKSIHTLTDEVIDKLAEYVLIELPVYLNGAYYHDSGKTGKYYECTVYPGLGLIDELIIGLHNGSLFPEIAKKLKLHNQIVIVEGYAN